MSVGTRGRVVLLAAVVVTLMPAAAPGELAARKHVQVPTVAPRPEDVATMDGILKAYYDAISGAAGQPRQWSRDRTLYIPGVRFVAMHTNKDGRPVAEVMDHQQYVDRTDPYVVGEGFYEREIHRVTRRFGNIAHVFSTYESRKKAGGPVIGRGINSLELYWDGQRWWVAANTWDQERPDNPIPQEYLP